MTKIYSNSEMKALEEEVTSRVKVFLAKHPNAEISVKNCGQGELEISASVEGCLTFFGGKEKGCFHLPYAEATEVTGRVLESYMKTYFNFYWA